MSQNLWELIADRIAYHAVYAPIRQPGAPHGGNLLSRALQGVRTAGGG